MATYRAQVAGGDGESDGQRRRALHVIPALVADAEDDEDEDKGDEELHAEPLDGRELRVDGGHSQRALDFLRSQSLKRGKRGENVIYFHCLDDLV